MKTRAEIKFEAKMAFMAQYGNAVAVCLLAALLPSVGSAMVIGLLLLPLIVGHAHFSMRLYRREQATVGEFFTAGFADYGRNLLGTIWMYLFIFLWSLLLIVPGIVKAFSYWMTPYLLADCPNVDPQEALKLSMRMTDGRKGEIFVMYLSFLGWMILSACTAMILYVLYVGPYMHTSMAGLYLKLKKEALDRGVVRPEELA
jgi:uncharacterized membrane protein